MYVCMYVCMYVYVYIYIYIYIYYTLSKRDRASRAPRWYPDVRRAGGRLRYVTSWYNMIYANMCVYVCMYVCMYIYI